MVRGLTVILCAAAVTAGSAKAEAVFSAKRKSLFAKQVAVLDGRAAEQYAAPIRFDVTGLDMPGDPRALRRFSTVNRKKFLPSARKAAARHGVPEALFLRLVTQESGWNPLAKSVKGAVGLAQLMPETAAVLGVDPRDPDANLDGGARYLAEQFRTFGSWRLALAAYNAGPDAVASYGGVPPYRETQGYVRAILGQ